MRELTFLFSKLKVTAKRSKLPHRTFTATPGLHAPMAVTRVPSLTRLASAQLTELEPKELQMGIFDWAGTTLDAHCLAPVDILIAVFKKQGIAIFPAEARMHMGLPKDEHCRKIFKLPTVTSQFLASKKRLPNEEDVQKLYADFPLIEAEILQKYSKLIPGAKEAVQALRKMGLKIGSTTGYPERMLNILKPLAKEQGYDPDWSVASDSEKNFGRPNPHMIFEIMRKLNVNLPGTVFKVDDAPVGIGEILSAGGWGIGMYGYGNGTGIESLEQLSSMPKSELEARQENAKKVLLLSGAHYVIKGPEALLEVVEDINERMAVGESPISELISEKQKPIFLYPRARAF